MPPKLPVSSSPREAQGRHNQKAGWRRQLLQSSRAGRCQWAGPPFRLGRTLPRRRPRAFLRPTLPAPGAALLGLSLAPSPTRPHRSALPPTRPCPAPSHRHLPPTATTTTITSRRHQFKKRAAALSAPPIGYPSHFCSIIHLLIGPLECPTPFWGTREQVADWAGRAARWLAAGGFRTLPTVAGPGPPWGAAAALRRGSLLSVPYRHADRNVHSGHDPACRCITVSSNI